MTFTEQLAEQNEYRIVLVLPWSRVILLDDDHKDFRLPRVSISRWRRPAEELTRAIREKWNLTSIVIDYMPIRNDLCQCAVVEVCRNGWQQIPHGLTPADPDELHASGLTPSENAFLRDILSGNSGSRGSFSRIGWLEEAQSWIRESVRDRAIKFNGDIHQLNASGSFALIRFGTLKPPAYWLKATGIPNLHECRITTALSEYFPESLPPLVAAREDWNAWITEEAGEPLSGGMTLPALEQAVLSLAELQKQSVRHTESLIAAGCLNRGIPVLQSELDRLIDYLEEAMGQQTSTKVQPVEPHRLHEIGSILRDACSEMQELGLPDTLVHNDINPGNILFDGSRCVFTDWAETFVGNPFLTFQHLLVQVERAHPETPSWNLSLTSLYKKQWLEYLSEPEIDRALALAPLLAIASYLYGRGSWLHSPLPANPRFQGYARSLARHMDRAAGAPELMEALCH